MSANRVCWSRAAIDFATQVDVGGLEVDDPRADALFRAIHQSLPVRRERERPVHRGERGRRPARLHPADHLERAVAAVRQGREGHRQEPSREMAQVAPRTAPRMARRLHRKAQHLAAASDRADPRRDKHAQGRGAPPGTGPGLLGDSQRRGGDERPAGQARPVGDVRSRHRDPGPAGPVARRTRRPAAQGAPLARRLHLPQRTQQARRSSTPDRPPGPGRGPAVGECRRGRTAPDRDRLQCRRERLRGPRARTPRPGEVPVEPGLCGPTSPPCATRT